jgi:ribosomal protein S18 acetylase RimI-like enzyme
MAAGRSGPGFPAGTAPEPEHKRSRPLTQPAHPLDRPVWNALASRQARFARGDGLALRFAPDIGPLAAAETIAAGGAGFDIVALGEADAAEMLALATLTRPGPYRARTHELGDFIGVRQDGRLVAMAGERLKPVGFAEVSAVCTHPDHRGRGYAGALMRQVASRMLARGETPFLHVYATNTGAIALYEALGFRLGREIVMTVLAREGEAAA